ncbi:aminotransferase class I/II-fold pyridoxal phosphate-dependent enzyme [Arthrobacter russicus]|uniref:N-succinyldiaminopimelate aminotransferase n=1 Tax=Arthrobacter russicus TaxID=172040 RepID=A0ABU1J7Z0_9MICC|nr:aminotransferase class I/II-fold pyridoxal phosphate-dependent enzyme [Arthrobacter russicus]MDR6268255.1 N-succinyldiaminopimelate aminotransferase [Arthrobacter russicus]
MTSPWQRAAQGANLLADDGSLGVTIFEEITSLAVRTGALNLGQGFPDQDGPAEIKALAREAIQSGANQYAPGKGLPELRHAIAEHQQRFYGLQPDPDREVLVTTGATEAIAAALLALVSPGDEVLSFEPFYDSYGAMIALAGGRHVTVPLAAPDFLPDAEALAAAFSDRTAVVLVNSPHNPSGAVFPPETLARIVALAERHGAVIISDEVYEHLTYGVPHVPIATLPGAAERTLTISSGGKTFSFTGWKIGWATGPAEVIAAVRTVKQFLSYSSGTPFQAAIAWGLRQEADYFSSLAAELQAKRDLLADGLRAAGLTVHLPQGGYFVNADVAPLGVGDAVALARQLPELIGVAAIPVAVFCHPEGAARNKSLLRFAFCKQESVLREAAARLAALGERL